MHSDRYYLKYFLNKFLRNIKTIKAQSESLVKLTQETEKYRKIILAIDPTYIDDSDQSFLLKSDICLNNLENIPSEIEDKNYPINDILLNKIKYIDYKNRIVWSLNDKIKQIALYEGWNTNTIKNFYIKINTLVKKGEIISAKRGNLYKVYMLKEWRTEIQPYSIKSEYISSSDKYMKAFADNQLEKIKWNSMTKI